MYFTGYPFIQNDVNSKNSNFTSLSCKNADKYIWETTYFAWFIYLPGHELCLKERRNLDKKSCSNSWYDVIQGPIPLRVKIMVIVRKTYGKEPFYGHCDHHINRANKSDAVERIMKPRKYVEKVVMVKIFPRCSYCFHDSKDDM